MDVLQDSREKSQQYIHDDNIFIAANPRIIYLRKLYFLLTFQLVFAALSIYIVFRNFSAVSQIHNLNYMFYVSLTITIFTMLIAFIGRYRVQNFPINWLLYVLFCISFAFTASYLVDVIDVDYAFMGLVSLAIQAFAVEIYVLTSKTELTFQGASLYIFASLIITLQVFSIFTQIQILHMIVVGVSSVIWGYYLVYDTQSSVSTPYHFDLQLDFKDDPVSGAVCVYMDIFVLLLRMTDLLRQTIIKYR